MHAQQEVVPIYVCCACESAVKVLKQLKILSDLNPSLHLTLRRVYVPFDGSTSIPYKENRNSVSRQDVKGRFSQAITWLRKCLSQRVSQVDTCAALPDDQSG